MKKILSLIRPKQWIKNTFVFLPMFFGGSLLNSYNIIACIATFLAFSFIASSIYCFNDLIDVEADRRHPVKRMRPVASGAVSIPQAYTIMGLTFLIAISILSITAIILPSYSPHDTHATLFQASNPILRASTIILFYWVLNLAYCAKLKQYAIVDVCVIAFGFVLRILAGGFATEVTVSRWLVLMTFLLTLFLSFAKRRDDVLRMEQTGEAPRKNTIRYNLTFINQAITITAAVTLVCYIMYTVSPEVVSNFHSDYLYLTTVFVLIGLLRYIQIAVVDKKSGDPTKVILKDHFTQLVVLAWGLSFFIIIYL